MTIALENGQHRLWTHTSSVWSRINSHLIVAPLFHIRHNQEIQLSSAISCGTLPSRLHAILLCLYLLSNAAYCCILDYHVQSRPSLIAELRGRTGHLAVMNMLGLFIFAARNNPFIWILRIPYDTFNLFHRWIGRIVIVESLAHTVCWSINEVDAVGWKGVMDGFMTSAFLRYGLLSSTVMIVVLFQTLSPIRHAFYEVFLLTHQALAVIAVIAITLHVTSQTLPQVPFMFALIGIWVLERTLRLLRLIYYNVSSRSYTKARVEALPGSACRVTFYIRRSWPECPSSHVYVYIPSISLWMSHPFSVAWVDRNLEDSPTITHASTVSDDTEVDFQPLPKEMKTTSLTCVIAARTGLTRKLYRKACASPGGVITIRAFIEGSYGVGSDSLRSFGTVLLFAGGAGITHQISLIKDLVFAADNGICCTRKLVLVWSVRNFEQLDWVRSWMEELITVARGQLDFQLRLHVTKQCQSQDNRQDNEKPSPEDCPKSKGTVYVNAMKIQLYPGVVTYERPRPSEIVEEEFQERIGAMSIGVCGPGALADDVRAAARSVMSRGNVDFWEEAFTW